MYSSTLSLTSVLDGGGLSTPRPGRCTLRKKPVSMVMETGFDLRTVQPVASRYTDYAVPTHNNNNNNNNLIPQTRRLRCEIITL
jgi:hypothetical protein